jgi:regulator of sigma E protease
MGDLLIFAAILALLILGHEFGHFLAARWRKVAVTEFGVGFPPRLATMFRAGGTRFTLNAIPLGGFVRPAGEDDPSIPGGLAGSSKSTRALVLLAGPTANILLGILAFTAAYKFAAPDPQRVLITAVAPQSPAESAGLRPGDLIESLDGEAVNGIDALRQATSQKLDQLVTLVVLRDGVEVAIQLTPRSNPPPDQGAFGITVGNPTRASSWGESVGFGLSSTAAQVENLVLLPSRLVRGDVAPDEARVSGLKGMYDMFAWAGAIDRNAQRPFLTLNLVGIISIGLAIANLLPLPALDGGRLAFVAFEAIFGRRISPRYEGMAHAIGFLFLLILMAYINLQDFTHPIVLPR